MSFDGLDTRAVNSFEGKELLVHKPEWWWGFWRRCRGVKTVWKHSSHFQKVSLLPETILDLIKSLLFMSFKDVSPGSRDLGFKRQCVCPSVCSSVFSACMCICVCLALWLRFFSWNSLLEGHPNGSLCDLSELATMLTWHLERSELTTKTDNSCKSSIIFDL